MLLEKLKLPDGGTGVCRTPEMGNLELVEELLLPQVKRVRKRLSGGLIDLVAGITLFDTVNHRYRDVRQLGQLSDGESV